uniref:Uncharacterized protein n=1 Tax=Corethron hystrix TaxID=216773 RepID=A0A7S1B9H2_9STRA|mmetsp:Transcript_17035/g.38344  ORF Transcript_17035/g.38344 Transcript_17035/m.38344 type:complete len:135 (+) Transcript_17035:188-592(+)
MRLDLIPCLLGMLPVALFVVPTLLAGTYLYLSNLTGEDGSELYPSVDTLSSVFLLGSGVIQFAMFIYAAAYIELTLRERRTEIASIPIDEEARRRVESEEEFERTYADVSRWEYLPHWVQCCLVSTLLAMTASC